MTNIGAREYHYDDILLLPNYSSCYTRDSIDLTTDFGSTNSYKSPIIPANMKTVINASLAIELASKGYFYIMHRFNGFDPFAFVQDMHERNLYASISIGVNDESKELIQELALAKLSPKYITIDIAHGDSRHMAEMLSLVKKKLPLSFVIAGNVCTTTGTRFLIDNGADAIKIGIGPGHVCTTKLMTGFSRPQFTAVLECCKAAGGVPVIADGGISHNGDVAKAMVAGATMVMCGHMLAGFDESPGEKIIHQDGRITKQYFGSASEHNKERKKNIEGRKIEIPYRGSIWDKYREMEESLRSSCSYAGIYHPIDLPKSCQWVVQR